MNDVIPVATEEELTAIWSAMARIHQWSPKQQVQRLLNGLANSAVMEGEDSTRLLAGIDEVAVNGG